MRSNMAPSPLKPAELRAWIAFLNAQSALIRRLENDLQAKAQMSLADYDVLIQLAMADSRRLRMSELSERVRLSPSGLTRRVDQLVKAGLVSRAHCASDRRGTFAVLTAAGVARVRRASPVHLGGVREYFVGSLRPGQLAALTAALEPLARKAVG